MGEITRVEAKKKRGNKRKSNKRKAKNFREKKAGGEMYKE